MKISPISFGINHYQNLKTAKDYVPTTVRHNSLSDMDFNIIADTIRCENLKNQMNVRLRNLRQSLNRCMAKNLYNNQQ